MSLGIILITLLAVANGATWTHVQQTLAVRRDNPALVVGNNKLYIVGGRVLQSQVGTDVVEVYNIDTGLFENPLILSAPRQNVEAHFVANNLVVVDLTAAVVEAYDTTATSWRVFANEVGATGLVSGAAGNYVVFLYEQANAKVWDVTTNFFSPWSMCSSQCEDRSEGVLAVTVGQYIVFAGGKDSKRVNVFNSATGSWSGGPFNPFTLTSPRSWLKAAVVGQRVFLAGGINHPIFDNSNIDFNVQSTVEVLDLQTNTQTTLTLPTRRSHFAIAAAGNRVLFAGGNQEGAGQWTNVVDVLDASTLQWLTSTSLSSIRANMGAVTVQGNHAVFGGGSETRSDFSASNRFDFFDSQGSSSSLQPTGANHIQFGSFRNFGVSSGNKAFYAGGTLGQGMPAHYLDIFSVHEEGCSAQWECGGVSNDYNFVLCINGQCICKESFTGSATAEDKCRCENTVQWDNGQATCVGASSCTGQWQCSGVTENYNFVGCQSGQCQCRTDLGFIGAATPEDKCRCLGTVVWSGSQPMCI